MIRARERFLHALTAGVAAVKLLGCTGNPQSTTAGPPPVALPPQPGHSSSPTPRSASRIPSTLPRVRKLVAEHLKISMQKVTPQALFVKDLGADSLDIVELVMLFEEEFEIEIPDGDFGGMMTTVGAAAAYLDRKTTGGTSNAH